MTESALTLPHEVLPEDSDLERQAQFVTVVLNPEDVQRSGKQNDRPLEEKPNTGNSNGILWVDWDGPTDPANPKKFVPVQISYSRVHFSKHKYLSWTGSQKWAATFVISSFTFISPLASSMIAPASEQVAHRFGITDTVIIAMLTSIFVLGYGKLSHPTQHDDRC